MIGMKELSVTVDRLTKPLQQFLRTYPRAIWIATLIWFVAIAGVTLVWRVGAIGLIDETEPLFVEAARHMMLTGDWVTPYFNDETRFDKPPLIYWLMVIAYKLFGVSEFAARLPSILSAVALTGFCFYVLWRFGAEAGIRQRETEGRHHGISPIGGTSLLTAFLGGTMLILNPNTFFWGRTGYSDMLLTACLGSALLAFFLGYAQPQHRTTQNRWYLAFYVLIALAILTKGPIGLILPGLIIGAFLLYLGNGWEVLREMRLLRGGSLVLLLTLPWYFLVTLANGRAFIDSFFGYHNVERFTHVVNRHAGPWYFHFLVILVGFLPWSVYLPAAIARLEPLQRRHWQNQPRSNHLGLFALFWFIAVLGFFTIATTKYFSYTLPLMPAAAILVAQLWTAYRTEDKRQSGFLVSGGLNLLLLAALAGLIVYAPNWLGDDPWMPNLGLRLQQSGLPLLGGVIWGATAIVVAGLLIRRTHWLWLANVIGFLAFLIIVVHPALLIADAERQLPLRQIAQTAVQVAQPGEELMMVGFKKPSLVFYTQRHVTYLGNTTEAKTYLQQVAKSSSKSERLVVLSYNSLEKLQLPPTDYRELTQAGVYKLIRITNPIPASEYYLPDVEEGSTLGMR